MFNSKFERPHISEMMKRVNAQNVLFSERVTRRDLMAVELGGAELQSKTINVWRNHAIEPLLSLAQPYIDYGRWKADFRLSQYDDSLMFSDHAPADAELLWLDSERYLATISITTWVAWLAERIDRLRATTNAPIIVATWFPSESAMEELRIALSPLPAIFIADLGAYCMEGGITLLERRTASVAGTPIGNVAQVHLARKLACHWLPATLFSGIKAIALDLDNTLHSGVLGEDGKDGVILTDAHRQLQMHIKSLVGKGIFVALVSRNEVLDVEQLFRDRQDYPLRWSDFSAIEISWGDKASALLRIAEKLRISSDAILFVDDNPGELSSVASKLPNIRTIYADRDARHTENAVRYFPALWRWSVGDDDIKRIADFKANAEREALLEETQNSAAYFEALQISLHYNFNANQNLTRLADLSRKTNQFNLSCRRFNEADLAARMNSPSSSVTSVKLVDRLADSGIIAAVVGERNGVSLHITELCVSCRALGRQLEDTLLIEAIRGMPAFDDCEEVIFDVEWQPRNQPAIEWLRQFIGSQELPHPGRHGIQAEKLRQFKAAEGIQIVKE